MQSVTQLQKTATALENDLDQQILAFTKISSKAFTKDPTNVTSVPSSSSSSPIINNEQLCESIAIEIDRLIRKVWSLMSLLLIYFLKARKSE